MLVCCGYYVPTRVTWRKKRKMQPDCAASYQCENCTLEDAIKMHQHATHDVHNASLRNTHNTWETQLKIAKVEIGKHMSKLQCVNAEYACRAIIRKQFPDFESWRLWRLWWTFLVVAILANAVTAAVKYDDDCPEVDRDISIRKRVCPKKHLKCVYGRSLSSLPVKALLKVVWTALFRRTRA